MKLLADWRKKPLWARAVDGFAAGLIIAIVYLVVTTAFAKKVPTKAPLITLQGQKGTVTMGGRMGRMVFMDFWASWCGPCKSELPLIEAFARQHPEALVEEINVEEPEFVVTSYAKDHHLTHVLRDEGGIAKELYAVIGLPTLVAVDPRGIIREHWSGFNPAVEDYMQRALSLYGR